MDSKVVTLIAECHLDVAYATALVQSGGRCEYCGCDLLHDRLGYEIGVVDCLLPKDMYLDDVAGCKDNWVLAVKCAAASRPTGIQTTEDAFRRGKTCIPIAAI